MLIILTGKTASGKDTILFELLKKYSNLKKVTTTTSRTPRKGEENGSDYNFIPETAFRQKIKYRDFLEYVEYGGNLYGTEKKELEKMSSQDLIWRIDPSRAGKIRELIKDPSQQVLVIYITVPDEVVLKRLEERKLSQGEIQKRMTDDANTWLKFKKNYDFIVENVPGMLDKTIEKITKIIEKNSFHSS